MFCLIDSKLTLGHLGFLAVSIISVDPILSLIKQKEIHYTKMILSLNKQDTSQYAVIYQFLIQTVGSYDSGVDQSIRATVSDKDRWKYSLRKIPKDGKAIY
jgi:hypothetical protein